MVGLLQPHRLATNQKLRTECQNIRLNGLSSSKHIELMDTINSLRSKEINHYVSLPQIIVCEDQSSGKSSVLKAISGLVLCKTPWVGISVSIVPDYSCSDSEKAGLAGFYAELEGFNSLANLIEDAKSAMGISMHGKAFSKDLLRVEISGSDHSYLTIVNLSGLIHLQTKNQIALDVKLIQDIVKSYMKQSRSIILAVISAKNNFANQVVLKLARTADISGNHILSIIIKPDMLYIGSESEALYHVLKNLDSETSKGSLAQRNALEDSFFAQGIWRELPESILGVGQLRYRLSKVLLNHIRSELLSLAREIEPRGTLDEQRLYLLCISESFQRLVKSAIDGNWHDSFFQNAETERSYQQRIRAIAQNLNRNFSTHLGRKSYCRQILGSSDSSVMYISESITFLIRDNFIRHIQVKMYRSKDRELPSLFNPMIIADLFQNQAIKLYQIIHFITYNAEFTEIIQKIRADRKRAEYAAVVKRFFNISTLQHASFHSSKLEELIETLVRETTELDMNRYAAIEALNCMKAYYKVARKRFVDNVAVEIIEIQLVSILEDTLSPSKVYKMDPTLLGTMAGESEEYRTLREQLKQQLEVLSKGAETCRRFVGNKFSSIAEA
ncbi:hypothetical protein M406DRAFT_336893 [Cryphonectria parasitica EP155]|uniref:GED domain-containing protein n=1 Tax=Cryphonectria parasitica (strain ATCC 38755 / EP155) TaxID=660469 RepID=A0A9P4Y7G6_CRYP1|nr:uncharacterized protein M406DRAFT_336893 [Cryphonectria parasitica EP155]KAF3768369.1 hypothetical protein M406DRAFT_336893 [Cryphonectria parasitica EP155]